MKKVRHLWTVAQNRQPCVREVLTRAAGRYIGLSRQLGAHPKRLGCSPSLHCYPIDVWNLWPTNIQPRFTFRFRCREIYLLSKDKMRWVHCVLASQTAWQTENDPYDRLEFPMRCAYIIQDPPAVVEKPASAISLIDALSMERHIHQEFCRGILSPPGSRASSYN
jgi:hypothetical protein